MMKRFPIYRQFDSKDCGPTCLKMILAYYGKIIPLEWLRSKSHIGKSGVSIFGLEDACSHIGFDTEAIAIFPDEFYETFNKPCIVHWKNDHFVVVYKIKGDYIYIADPDKGKIRYKKEEFKENWLNRGDFADQGIVLLIEPTERLASLPNFKTDELINLRGLLKATFNYKSLMFVLLFTVVFGGILQLFSPFLTKAILDVGVANKSVYFISLMLSAQLIMFISQMSIDFLKRWILLYVSIRINLGILANFLQKLLRLPISFFETKHVGDMLQRLNDHNRIETFLTGTAVSTIFSGITLSTFAIILFYYNSIIFVIFFISSLLYVLWVVLFLKKRKKLDIRKFDLQSKNQNKVFELINGMQDIKLNLCHDKKRWEWEQVQANLFELNSLNLKLNQFQEIGAGAINQIKNILIIFVSAQSVISGTLTLGEMLAIQFIVGQLNSPIEHIIQLLQSGQDAKLSIERLNEVYVLEEEENSRQIEISEEGLGDILINNLWFSYPGMVNDYVLKDINLTIKEGEMTAIVGASGSGKTTLLKLLLLIYEPTKGNITVQNTNLNEINHSSWRKMCGTVLQDGYIFSDSIAENIALDNEIDYKRLYQATETANILDYVNELSKGFDSLIGSEGSGISQGQKQRILIARAVYKNPKLIFFDEATNSLDASNESIIMKNLEKFFEKRTTIVVAHRLSTVKKAHKIVVMNKGQIVEIGTHKELISKQGYYFSLVKDQIELDC